MKTHMSNTEAFKLKNDVVGHQHFLNHQKTLHSSIKPRIDNKRKEQIKIVKNKKVELNTNPRQHVNQLYKDIYTKPHKSNIDNKANNYDDMKHLLADKIKKNKYERYAESEHGRNVRNMNDRVKNCKNLQQRKKDNCDPIVNPTYFMKNGKDVPQVTIDSYCKQILGMSRPQSGVPAKTTGMQFKAMVGSMEQPQNVPPPSQLFGKVPTYAKERPRSAHPGGRQGAPVGDDLPGCTFKEILNHIVDNKLFRDVEMKVLYVRLCHRYGEENMEQLWQQLMDELQK